MASWTSHKVKEHKPYLWGLFYKGHAYYEIALTRKTTLMIRRKGTSATTGKVVIYKER